MKFILLMLFSSLCISCYAQVNICKDEKGKKIFTNLSCEKIKATQESVIEDIPTQPKECPALKKQMETARLSAENAKKMRTPGNDLFAWNQNNLADALETKYMRECIK